MTQAPRHLAKFCMNILKSATCANQEYPAAAPPAHSSPEECPAEGWAGALLTFRMPQLNFGWGIELIASRREEELACVALALA